MPTDIRQLDLTLATPAENLACDEALLDDREARGGPGVLRFWESPNPFIVIGYAARVAEEVDLDACRAASVPVLRRCSGGGTVLQGPGCLNYSLILPLASVGGAGTITETNRFVMNRQRAAVESLAGAPVSVAGHTDLAVGNRKFSGNAQRRKRAWFLFHGTFLTDFDLALVEKLLRQPPRQPDYRQQRSHREFMTRFPASSQDIRHALATAWDALTPLDDPPEEASWKSTLDALVRSRYGQDAWNFKQ